MDHLKPTAQIGNKSNNDNDPPYTDLPSAHLYSQPVFLLAWLMLRQDFSDVVWLLLHLIS